MARALSDILTELNTTYNPLRQRQQEVYTKGLEAVNPQETADLSGLETAKTNAFNDITVGANRRGLFYSGMPIAEQSKYVGENYLPSVAALKNRYAGIRGNLYETLQNSLSNYDIEQNKYARDIYNTEIAQDLERQRLAQEATSRASSGGAGTSGISFGGGGTNKGQTLGATGNWQTSLSKYLAAKYAKEPSASRSTQDSWVNNWVASTNMDPNQAFAYYDTLYPWAKYSDQARSRTNAASISKLTGGGLQVQSGSGLSTSGAQAPSISTSQPGKIDIRTGKRIL